MRVVGVDGCRGGWISASLFDPENPLEFCFHQTLDEVLTTFGDSAGNAACIAIDIPIGLAEGEPRRCDIEARGLLGGRRSSVFPAPDRRVLEAFVRDDLDYAETNSLSKRLTGKGLSAQTYNIMDRIAKADTLLTPELQQRVTEAHPELSFLALAGHPMRSPKKKPEGFAERLSLLKKHLPGLSINSRPDARNVCRHAQPDDVLDSAAVAATAWRITKSECSRVPSILQEDTRGLRMEITF